MLCEISGFLFSENFFGYSGSSVVPCKSVDFLFYFISKWPWYLDRGYIKYVYCFGKYGHFNYIDSSNPWTRNIFPIHCVFFQSLLIMLCSFQYIHPSHPLLCLFSGILFFGCNCERNCCCFSFICLKFHC